MKHNFKLPKFPDSNFEMEYSVWTGKSTLYMDGTKIERSPEKGKPYLIPAANKQMTKAFPKPALPEMVPLLEIDGKKHHIVEKLKLYQYLLAGLPLVLLFVGGAIGGVLGGAAVVVNLSLFRQKGTETSKYLKVLGVVLASFALYAMIASFFLTKVLQ